MTDAATVVWTHRGKVAGAAAAAALFFMLVLFPAAARKSGSPDNRVADLQFAFTKARFVTALQSWSARQDDAIAVVKRDNIIRLDFAFPVIYGLAFASSYAALLAGRLLTRRDWLFVAAPAAAAAFDYLENLTHLALLSGVDNRSDLDSAIASGRFDPTWILVGSGFALVKYVLLLVCLVGIVLAAWRRWRRRSATA